MMLIIGGTGNIGRPLLQQLADAKAPVKALLTDAAQAAGLPRGVDAVIGDLQDAASLDRAMKGVDTVFLLSPVHPELARMQTSAVEAAQRAGARRLVKSSTMDASTSSAARLPRMHGEVEDAIRKSGLRFTFVRPNFFMQNLLMDAMSVKAKDAVYTCVGDARVSFVDARDVAALVAHVLLTDGHDGKTYDATGPAAVSYTDIVGVLSRLTGRSIQHVSMPPEAHRAMLKQVGMPDWGADAFEELNASARRGEAATVSTALKTLAGRAPRSVAAFLEEHAAVFR